MATLMTGKQVGKFIELFEEKTEKEMQDLFESGLLTDLRDAPDVSKINRSEFRITCGYNPDLLLEHLGTITIPATIEAFIARKKFMVNTSDDATVKISFIGNNFTEWFLGEDGKVEKPSNEQELRYARLRKSSVDKHIVAELGGEAKAETTLSVVFYLMNGQAGVLLTNGCASVFYIKDKKGLLRAVFVYWNSVGWFVYAGSVEDLVWWHDGSRVFSSNS